jgi:hypothetical protein
MKPSVAHERIERRWWRDWWAEDFSWAALRRRQLGQNKHWHWSNIFKKKTLQSYWRLDASGAERSDAELLREGELVPDPNGNLWHLAHVPLRWRDGTPAKAEWNLAMRDRLRSLVTARLLQAEKSGFSFASEPNGWDGRAQLQGSILLDAPSLLEHPQVPMRLKCEFACLPPWNAAGEVFGDGASFARSLFTGHTRLQDSTFQGCVSFKDARFLGDVSGTNKYPGWCDFQHAIFLGDARFDRSIFADGRFDFAHFSGRFECFAATLKICFDGAVFEGPASFLSSTATSFCFSRVRARSAMDFGAVTLTNAWLFFRNSVFSHSVSFSAAKLPRKIENLVDGFHGTHFRVPPDFGLTGVHWIAALDGTIFDRGMLVDKPAPAVVEHEFTSRLLPGALKVKGSEEPEKTLERQLNSLAGGCRTMKLEAAKAGDAETEQLYARLEEKVIEQRRAIPAAAGQNAFDEES